MALFGRNKEEESDTGGGYSDEDEFNEDPSYAKADASRYAPKGEGRFSRRKFRDLNPKNKKKRKEPPKPWGKKERMIALIILLVTVIASAILAFGAGSKGKIHLSLPKFDFNSLNIFKEETIIVEKSH
jgi:hypothetical protein